MRVIRRAAAVVGTGAAGFNAAERLWDLGVRDLAIVTEGIQMGTSRNTGSDKQTYYKLTLAGGEADSVQEMARSLFDGQCMDGDLALCEAALSVRCFLHLAELGVPFPVNRYGEYVGYRTDHDPRSRATSVGPYTSREMTRALEKSVRSRGIEILDRLQVIRLIGDGKRIYGMLCLDLDHAEDPEKRFVAMECPDIVYAVGGPAGIYADRVYPTGHFGASGAAFRAGALGRNLTEWQYGLASVRPRWNVSGTYMQVLPRFLSADREGGDVREFLPEHFPTQGEMLSCVFLKGYQWPFDVRKIQGGSSLIDLLVYRELLRGRRVFLDFMENPGGDSLDFSALSPEARTYLEKAGACFGTPAERLRHMNAPALEFYREHGVDLEKEWLEISLCAQHNNGGIAVDRWWRTGVEGLYAAGEAAGTHGVYRPGGSALNAGQAGSTRAAQHIARHGGQNDEAAFETLLKEAVREAEALCASALEKGRDTVRETMEEVTEAMSRAAGPVRNAEKIRELLRRVQVLRETFSGWAGTEDASGLSGLFRMEDMLLTQEMVLSSMLDYIREGGKSRGSALYINEQEQAVLEEAPERLRPSLDGGAKGGVIQEVRLEKDGCTCRWRPVRPIPEEDDFFENVWRSFRENGNVDG